MSFERLRKLRRIGGHAAFGGGVFVVAFYASFPYERVKEQVVAIASRNNVDVQIGSVGPAFGMGLSFEDVTIANRPPDNKPLRIRIDEATVSLAPLARLSGDNALSVSAEALGGEIDLDWRGSKTAGRVQIQGREIAMSEVPGVKEAINLPLSGKLDVDVDLGTTANRMGEASGRISWKCGGCAIGDGKAKLKIEGNPLLAEGLGLPRLRLGDLSGRIVFEKGVGKLQGVQARSPDGELHVEGEIRLADPLPMSQVDLYITFKLSDALLKSADKLQILLQIAESMGKRPDGLYGLRLTGTFSRLNPPQWAKSSPFGATGAARPAAPRPGARPVAAVPAAPEPVAPDPTPAPAPAPEGALVNPATDPNANLPRYPIETPSSDDN